MFHRIIEADNAKSVCWRRKLDASSEQKPRHSDSAVRHQSRSQAQKPDRSQCTDVEYHLTRARSERDIAYRSADALAADSHMRLSVLHLQRACCCGPSDGNPSQTSVRFER